MNTRINIRKIGSEIIFVLTIILFILLVLFPFYWILVTSLKKPGDLYNMLLYIKNPTLDSYIAIFTQRPFARYIVNSFIVAGVTTLISVVIASFSGYAISRLNFPGKTIILGVMLAISMFPAIATITPIYIFMRNLGLRNTYSGLIIPYTSFALPMAIWYLTSFFKEIPLSIDEAAIMDGASPFQVFTMVITPLAAPGVFTTAILIFITAWNEYIFAFTINTDDVMRTVPVGITMFQSLHTIPWTEISAAIVVVTIPIVILVLIFQRRIIGGLSAGAVKE